MDGRKDLRNTEESLFSYGKNPFQQTLLVVLTDNELTSPTTLYSEFHRIKILGTPKNSYKHESKATLVFLLFICGLLSLLNSLCFVLLCFLQSGFSKYKLARAWKIQNYLTGEGKMISAVFIPYTN